MVSIVPVVDIDDHAREQHTNARWIRFADLFFRATLLPYGAVIVRYGIPA